MELWDQFCAQAVKVTKTEGGHDPHLCWTNNSNHSQVFFLWTVKTEWFSLHWHCPQRDLWATSCESPWYNHNGWLGVKVTKTPSYLLTYLVSSQLHLSDSSETRSQCVLYFFKSKEWLNLIIMVRLPIVVLLFFFFFYFTFLSVCVCVCVCVCCNLLNFL